MRILFDGEEPLAVKPRLYERLTTIIDRAKPRPMKTMRPHVGADTILSGTIYLSVDSIPLSSRNGLFSFPATIDYPKKSALKACKLLAWSSENVEKEAYYYAIEGKLTEFAILLMVAREEVVEYAVSCALEYRGVYGSGSWV
ncbi:hypothetical protein RHMOL_Rhmol09G0144000 [Rhododendron molle]|uniref:Uncharacterized protein n=1 Tax=Rhododendron molle TaxID=49168 RepID=A0ACC0MDP3_RHOML|nr:hypothetical protein RHMOL_Rhmol09G0144000 [Rhododendron molle]